jgi:hypothetical protein
MKFHVNMHLGGVHSSQLDSPDYFKILNWFTLRNTLKGNAFFTFIFFIAKILDFCSCPPQLPIIFIRIHDHAFPWREPLKQNIVLMAIQVPPIFFEMKNILVINEIPLIHGVI